MKIWCFGVLRNFTVIGWATKLTNQKVDTKRTGQLGGQHTDHMTWFKNGSR